MDTDTIGLALSVIVVVTVAILLAALSAFCKAYGDMGVPASWQAMERGVRRDETSMELSQAP